MNRPMNIGETPIEYLDRIKREAQAAAAAAADRGPTFAPLPAPPPSGPPTSTIGPFGIPIASAPAFTRTAAQAMQPTRNIAQMRTAARMMAVQKAAATRSPAPGQPALDATFRSDTPSEAPPSELAPEESKLDKFRAFAKSKKGMAILGGTGVLLIGTTLWLSLKKK